MKDFERENISQQLDLENFDKTKPLNIPKMRMFIRKGEYAGQTIKAKIVAYNPANQFGRAELIIQVEGESSEKALSVTGVNLNELNNLWGAIPANWEGHEIYVKFSNEKEFISDNKLKKGCTAMILKA